MLDELSRRVLDPKGFTRHPDLLEVSFVFPQPVEDVLVQEIIYYVYHFSGKTLIPRLYLGGGLSSTGKFP